MRAMLSGLRARGLLTLMLAGAWACQDGNAGRVLDIDAIAPAFLLVFIDDNLNRQFNLGTDTQLRDQQIKLRMLGDTHEHRTQTDSAGVARFFVPVGRYIAVPDSAILGDSLEVVAAPAEIRVVATDTALETMILNYFIVTLAEARALPPGRKVWTYGVVLNPPFLFGDSTVHVTADSVAMRMTAIRPNVPLLPGDSAYFLGRIALRDGQPTMMVSSIVIRSTVPPPEPDTITAVDVTGAKGGRLDARFVRIGGAEITDTSTVGLNRLLTIEDSTGEATVFLANTINFGPPALLRPGVRIDIEGLLLPDVDNPGTWLLKPRGLIDIVILP